MRDILGTNDADKRLTFDATTNTIRVDLTGIDTSKNEGAALLNDLVTSGNKYDLSVGPTAQTLAGAISLDPKGKKNKTAIDMVNLDNNPDDRYNTVKPPRKRDAARPAPGIDDEVAMNISGRATRESSTNLKPATTESVVFHELAEAYAKVEHGKQYSDAHQEAIDRETRVRDQRPYLKDHNPGSGPGDRVIIKK